MPGLRLPIPIPGKDLAVLIIRMKKQRSLHTAIKCVERVCEPLFVLTPYQVESKDTVMVVVPKAAASSVLEELRSCSVVEAVELYENLSASALFPIKLDNYRCVIHGESVHEALFAGIYGYTAPSVVKTMFYHIGFYSGKSVGERLLALAPHTDREQLLTYYLENIFTISGDGLVKEVKLLENGMLRVVIEDLIECAVQRKHGLNHGSHFYRGFLAGLASGVLEANCAAIERTCITRGDHYCTFIVSTT